MLYKYYRVYRLQIKYTTLTGPMKYPTLASSISRLRVMELHMTVQIVSTVPAL